MPFGLVNAIMPIDEVVGVLNHQIAFAYFGKIIICLPDFNTHLVHLQKVLVTIDTIDLRLKATKCTFMTQEVVCLGHRITAAVIFPDLENTLVAENTLTPTPAKELKTFLGFTFRY